VHGPEKKGAPPPASMEKKWVKIIAASEAELQKRGTGSEMGGKSSPFLNGKSLLKISDAR